MSLGRELKVMRTVEKVSLDSQILTYLLEEITGGASGSADHTLVAEKQATLRIWRSQLCDMFIVPAVSREMFRISRTKAGTMLSMNRRDAHALMRNLHFNEVLHLDADAVDRKARHYQRYHPFLDDCYVVAESELAELDVLLSNDIPLLTNLRNQTVKLHLMRPSEYETKLRARYGEL